MSEPFDPSQYVTTPNEAPATPAKKTKWSKTFDTPVNRGSRQKAQKVSGQGKSIMSGNNRQVNTRLPPEWYDEMIQFREEIGCNMEQLKRWMMGYALNALRRGVRPQTKATQSVEIDDLS